MDLVGDQFLACTWLTLDEYRRWCASDLVDDAEHLLHLRIFMNDVALPARSTVYHRNCEPLLAELECLADRLDQILEGV